MTKAIECLQRGETIITVDMLRRFTRDSSSGMAGSALLNLSFVFQLEDDIVHAEHAVQLALDKEPFNTHALVQLGNIRYGLEKYEEAFDLFNKKLNADPGYKIAEYNAGLTLKHLQKFTEARERFERLGRRHPHDTDVMLQLAESIATQGRDFEKSRRIFAEATLATVGLCHNPFANASFPVYLDIKALKGLIVFSEMQSSSTDKQGPDKEPMTHNEATEQIL
ncbi:MAG: hypothetical protein EZS28_050200, partial [Streblomastix strix]